MGLRSFVRKLSRETEGIASLEFVIILMPMLLIFFAMIQFGSMFYYHSEMQIAARDTARRLAEDLTLSPEANGAPVLCSVAAAGFAEDYGCSIADVPGAGLDVAASYCTESTDGETRYDAVVQVTAPMDEVSLVDLLGVGVGKTVTSSVTMRVHPLKAQDVVSLLVPPECAT